MDEGLKLINKVAAHGQAVEKVKALYNAAPDLRKWSRSYEVFISSEEKDWQICRNRAKAINLLFPDIRSPRVIGTFKSKELTLPILAYKFENLDSYVLVFDDMYEFQVSVVSDKPVELPAELVRDEVDEDYINHKFRCYRNQVEEALPTFAYWYEDNYGLRIVKEAGKVFIEPIIKKKDFSAIASLDLPDDVFTEYERKSYLFSISFGLAGPQRVAQLVRIFSSLQFVTVMGGLR